MPRKTLPYQKVTFMLRPAVKLRIVGLTHRTHECEIDGCDDAVLDAVEVSPYDEVPSDCEYVVATPVSDDDETL